METKSRIKFNPATREIEVEGSESFVKTYFNKIQKLLSVKEETEKVAKSTRPRKAPLKKRGDIFDAVIAVIRDSKEGVNTVTLKNKTGLTGQQIRSVVYRAEKMGRIRRAKRGIYTVA